MYRKSVDSSNLVSVGYDPTSRVLEIEFKGGSVYQYYQVPESVYRGLMSADSHGKYFDQEIKKGGYDYDKV